MAALLVLIMLLVNDFNHPYYRKGHIRSDARGYFAYLPAIFVHGDLTWQSSLAAEEELLGANKVQHYLHHNQEGKLFNKYYPGMALLQAPFYLMGTGLDAMLDKGPSGYGFFSVFFVQLGALCYGLLAFVFLSKFLKNAFPDNKWTTWVAFLLIVGTNVINQMQFYPTYSHIYSFAISCAFIYYVQAYALKVSLKYALLIGVCLGVLVLIRPTNILIIFALPLVLQSSKAFKVFFTDLFTLKSGHILSALFSFSVLIFLLLLLNYLQTGSPFNWSYQGEGFNFSKPEIFETLFGYRIGLFTHVPLTLFAMFGFYYVVKQKDYYLLLTWGLYFVIITYVIASWWCWDYGGQFGQRVYTEHTWLFAFPLLYLVKYAKYKRLVWGILGLSVVLFSWRLYQVKNHLAPGRFTAQTYWKSLTNWQQPEGVEEFRFERNCKPFGTMIAQTKVALDESTEVVFNAEKMYGCSGLFTYPKIRGVDRFYVRCKLNKSRKEYATWNEVYLVVDGRNEEGETINYHSTPIYDYYKEAGEEAMEIELTGEVVDILQEVSSLKVYIWNKALADFTLHQVEVSVEQYHVE